MNENGDKKGAAVRFPPPLLLVLTMLAAYAVDYWVPIRIGLPEKMLFLGAIPIILAIGFLVYVLLIYVRAKTSIEPWKPTTAIITTGVYARSRNPIYLAFCLVPIGLGILLDSLWMLLSFLPASVLIHIFAIKKEEAYLEKKFGKEYLDYKRRVRRWI